MQRKKNWGIFSTWKNRKRLTFYSLFLVFGGLCCLAGLGGCHSKDHVWKGLEPPLALTFSTPNGEVLFIRPSDSQVVAQKSLYGRAVVRAVATPSSDYIAVADAQINRVTTFSLPDFDQVDDVILGGLPLDMAWNASGQALYIITRNSTVYHYTLSEGLGDPLELQASPRRMSIRPPDLTEAWIVCPETRYVYLLDLINFVVSDSILFPNSPTDVKFSDTGEHVYIALRGLPGVIAEYVTATRSLQRYITTGGGPFDLAVSSDNHYLVACDSSFDIACVWDLARDSTWTLHVGHRPQKVCFIHGTHQCFVMPLESGKIVQVNLDLPFSAQVDSISVPPYVRELTVWEN